MDINEALDELEALGHRVDRTPIRAAGKICYHIDGLPRSEEQILSHLVHGTPLHEQFPTK